MVNNFFPHLLKTLDFKTRTILILIVFLIIGFIFIISIDKEHIATVEENQNKRILQDVDKNKDFLKKHVDSRIEIVINKLGFIKGVKYSLKIIDKKLDEILKNQKKLLPSEEE